MIKVIKYATPTLKEAKRIKQIVYLLLETDQRKDGDPALFTASFEQEKPLIRVGLYGNPDVECHYCIGSYNYALMCCQDPTWDKAIALYHKNPWPVAYTAAWCVFIWNCLTGKRR